MADARFADGIETALNLGALDADDLAVLSALLQDAVLPLSEIKWQAQKRRFACLLNRFRWEDHEDERAERVRSLLVVNDVRSVRSHGIDRAANTPEQVLSLAWTAGEDGTGTLVLTLAGGGAIALEVEALDIALRDVTRPYAAPSGKRPKHDLG